MRKLSLFVREMWRFALFYAIGYALIVVTIWLSTPLPRYHGNFVYAYLLGMMTLATYLVLEYARRHSFYVEVLNRLQNPISLPDASTMTADGTPEQRLFVQLLRSYHGEYVRELDFLAEQQRVHEVFATQFAHQIKTPITVMQLLEQEMRSAYVSSPDILDYLDNLAEERLRIETSVSIMLNSMRLGSFSVDAHMQDIHLQELIREVINEHKSQWIRRSLFPKIEAKISPIIVKSDRKWLLFIIDQIVRNALQYGYRTDENGNLTKDSFPFLIQIAEHTNQVKIGFIDEGIGIPERDVAHVFEAFYTGSNGRSHSRATGMGMYLVNEVCKRLGHTIQIESIEGIGTKVFLTIFASEYLSPMDVNSNVGAKVANIKGDKTVR